MVYGITFDSQAEAQYYMILKGREKAGEIRNLKRQVSYSLLPTARLTAEQTHGKPVTLRSCSYLVDFEFDDLKEQRHRWIDVKGCRTKEFIIKKKMMWYLYHIYVEEITI